MKINLTILILTSHFHLLDVSAGCTILFNRNVRNNLAVQQGRLFSLCPAKALILVESFLRDEER